MNDGTDWWNCEDGGRRRHVDGGFQRHRRQAGRWAAEDQSGQHQTYRPPPPGRYQRPMFQPRVQQPYQQAPSYPPQPVYARAVPPVDDMSARLRQLQQLGSLKAQGILTDAEFEAQKLKILGS